MAETGNKRRESADDWNKTGKEDGLIAIALIEGMGTGQIALVKETGIAVLKKAGAKRAANPIVSGVP